MTLDKLYHRAVIMAIEQGKLQHLIFDNKVLSATVLLQRFLEVILQLILNYPGIAKNFS